jgi:hypothetical protein
MSRWMNELEADTARRLLNSANLRHDWRYEPRQGWYVHIVGSECLAFFLLREVRAYLHAEGL